MAVINKDLAPVIAELKDVPDTYNYIFNIRADQPNSVNQLAHSITQAMRIEPNTLYLPSRNEVKMAYSSHERSSSVCGDVCYRTLKFVQIEWQVE